MNAKSSKKPSLLSKAVIELVIIILAAVFLFSILHFLKVFDKIRQNLAQEHLIFDLFFFTAILAAVLVIFAFRRWLELRRIYKELIQSEQQLLFQSKMLDEIGDSVVATDLDGKITYINQAQCNWRNKTKDELLGQSVRLFDTSNSIEQTQNEIIRTTLEKGLWSGEIVSRTADGRKIIVECRTWLMKDKNGKPTGMCGVTRDVTEKKSHLQQLQFQSALLDEIGDNITATDLEGKITYVNQSQCRRVKMSKDQLIGQPVEIYGQDSSLGATQEEILQTTLKMGKWSGEIVNTASDGSKIIVDCYTWLMKDETGRLTGLCGVSRDITEGKERQQELLRHKQYLEALDAAAGILLNSITEIKYDEFLAALGPASDADRVHIFLKVTDKKLNIPLRRKTQWCRSEKIPPVPSELTENRFFGEIFPEWQKILVTGKHICLSTENFPRQQLDFWEYLQNKALLIVPILIDNQLCGFMSFDNCTDTRQWTESEIEFLKTAANNLASAIKRLEIKKELKEQRDFAQKLIETAQTIVLVLDKEGNIVTFNQYFEKLSGYLLDEVKGKSWFDTFLPQEDREKTTWMFQKAVNDISVDGNINPIVTKDGKLRQIEWFGRTLKDGQDRTIGVLSTGQDITERLKAEEQLRESEESFRTMFDSSNDGILIADVDNKKFFTGNKAICDMLGYSIEEIRKIGVSDIHPKENLPFVEEQFDKQKRNEITLAENIPMKRKDGSVFFADIKSNSITLSGKKCLLGSFRDITERRRAAEELKKAHLELEQRVVQRTAALQQVNTQLLRTIEERDRIQKILQETEKLAGAGKLAAQIAHEINNPLAGIKNSFLLVKDAIPSNHRYFEYVGRIEKEINRVSQIVKQTFDLYRPDMRSPDKFRVSETLRDIAELLKIASEEKQVQIKIDCPYETTVTLSEALFRQVIFNIVQNAIQASPPQSSIEIAAVTSNSMLRVQVSDEGSGIDEKIKDKIFEPFFTTGTGGPKSGLGLGLAITKDIINAMEGKIYFENRRPAGTVFHISIPIPDEPKS